MTKTKLTKEQIQELKKKKENGELTEEEIKKISGGSWWDPDDDFWDIPDEPEDPIDDGWE